MSARQSEDNLGLGGMLPDPAVLERMLSAAGLRVNGAGAVQSMAGGNPNQPHQSQNNPHAGTATTSSNNITSFAAALESIVREEQEAAAAADAAAANAALLRAASEQQLRGGGGGGGGGGGVAAAAPPLPLPHFKACCLCKIEQPIDNFYRVVTSKDGRDARCRTCDAKKCAERRKRRRERQELEGGDNNGDGDGDGDGDGRERQPPLPAEKLCRKCAASKPASSFYRNRASGDGLCDLCKPCFNGAAEARRDEKVRQRAKAAAAAAALSPAGVAAVAESSEGLSEA